jgi:hypothetical protein
MRMAHALADRALPTSYFLQISTINQHDLWMLSQRLASIQFFSVG